MASKQTSLLASKESIRPKHRIIVVGGDKGGVGKSFTARALLHYLREINVPCLAVDTDPSNATFASFLDQKLPYELVDIDAEAALDTLVEKVLAHGVVLVDFAARAHERFAKWVEEVGFGEIQRANNVELTVFFVLGGEPESNAILKDVNEKMSADTHLVIVKNQGRTESFRLYEEHHVRDLVLARQAVEIDLPKLLPSLAQTIAQRKLLFHEALDPQSSDPLTIMERQRVSNFTRVAAEQFDRVKSYLN